VWFLITLISKEITDYPFSFFLISKFFIAVVGKTVEELEVAAMDRLIKEVLR
jgi:hypothetical protein